MKFRKSAIVLAVSLALAACGGDDGDRGDQGPEGAQGPQGETGATGTAGTNGLNSLIQQTNLAEGHSHCFKGGVMIESGVDDNENDTLDTAEVDETNYVCQSSTPNTEKNFNRIASFLVCTETHATCDTGEETAAEIVAASSDGNTLIYTDSPQNRIGFTDISDASNPTGLGTLDLSGEPTSVAVRGDHALVAINTSADFINVDGELAVIDIDSQNLVTTLDLGGQPDSIAVSPDGTYAAVVIENERDEDLGDGAPPQLPAGGLVIIDLDGEPASWSTRDVNLDGIADLFSGDPEPEYIDINSDNIAVMTLQENNHLILVDLSDGSIVNDFSAGTVDLTQIDTTEEDPALISLSESDSAIPREPDGVTWINNEYFATADEGDLDGGSRGFTVFNTDGDIVYSSGNSLDHLAVRYGHYPDDRSGNKGNEPENVEAGIYGGDRYLFVASERASLVFVYDAADPTKPVLKQTLPAGAGPEGVLALPSRNLLIAASEEDDRGDKIRSVLNIYQYNSTASSYPTIRSADRLDGTPIPWSALSGLAADPMNDDTVYAVEDSFYQQNRVLTLDVDQNPAVITAEMNIVDSNDVFAAMPTVSLADDSVADDHATRVDVFDEADLALLINNDKTVNVDPEGISKANDGGFWIVSEGSGTVGSGGSRPVNSLNFLFKTDEQAVIEDVVTLPSSLNNVQLRFGLEGVAEYNGNVYVAFQRVWDGDTNVRIGVYNIAGESWSFFFYPLETATSQNDGWVGLSDLTSLGDGEFLVIERDNQGGPDASIKRLYSFDVTGLSPDDTVTKTLVRDLMNDLSAPGGLTYEKIEGLAVVDGDVLIVNDNDGVDDNSGETQLINLGNILD